MRNITFLLALTFTSLIAFGQSKEKTILTIDNNKISAEEFKRVYSKNNTITPEAEKKSVDEYLDLFINYKLKVIEAENLGYDTVKSFITEFQGYEEQLATPYIQNPQIKEKMIEDLYNKLKYTVRASHILINCSSNATPEDTLKAFQKIKAIRDRIVAGESFEVVAKETSNDPSVKTNGGDLGYFSVFAMVFPFENAAYSTPTGEVSSIVRTRYGYHILKVTEKNENPGRVLVAHIMVRLNDNASAPEEQASLDKINKAYDELVSGNSWDSVVQKYSEYPASRAYNGELGWFGVGEAPAEFMAACFPLEINQFSKPVKTQGGYHIAYIKDKKPIGTFEEEKEKLAKKLDNNAERKELLKNTINNELKKKYGYKAYPENVTELAKKIDTAFYSRTWKPEDFSKMVKPVLTLGEKNYSQYDYAKVIATKTRMASSKEPIEVIFAKAFENYTEDCLKEYVQAKLPEENDDYKYLLQEYHDGILLFNLTNDKVWKKAQEDTTGLKNFYETAPKYEWNERIKVIVYQYTDTTITEKLVTALKQQNSDSPDIVALNKNVCPTDSINCLGMKEKTYEKGQDAMVEKLTWQKGSYLVMGDKKEKYLYYVVDLLPKESKDLLDARGVYIADYQNYLEKIWVSELRAKYPVLVNKAVLKKVKAELNKK